MEIRITSGRWWYESLLGKTYDVKRFETLRNEVTERGEAVPNSDVYFVYHPEESDGCEFFVLKEDCEIVSEAPSPAKPQDMVESPPHYQNARFETIEIIEEITAGYSDGFVAHCAGTAIKYIARAPYKHGDNGLEDLRKSVRYLQYAIERIEKTNQAK
jgi:hypothetical protein